MTPTNHLEFEFRVVDGETVDQAIRRANYGLDAKGNVEGRAWVPRYVRRIFREHRKSEMALAAQPSIEAGPYFLAAADPTGESAVRNVTSAQSKTPGNAASTAPGASIQAEHLRTEGTNRS